MNRKKEIFLSLLISLSVLFSACSKSAEKENTPTGGFPSATNSETKASPETDNSAHTSVETTSEKATEATVTENNQEISLTDDEQKVFEKVNQLRKLYELYDYEINYDLCKLAREKAKNIRDLGYFEHHSPDLGYANDMMDRAGIGYKSAAENLAKGELTPSTAMLGWMNSPGHKKAIINETYKEIGIGVVYDDDGVSYWVQMFIDPK